MTPVASLRISAMGDLYTSIPVESEVIVPEFFTRPAVKLLNSKPELMPVMVPLLVMSPDDAASDRTNA